jgi:hypothetical protein
MLKAATRIALFERAHTHIHMQSVMMIIILVGNVGCVVCDLEFCYLFALQVITETNFVVIYYFLPG